MCLIAFAIHAAPGLPLLLAGNRDESLQRPTLPLHRWTSRHGTPVVGGRDLMEGGTWLAATAPGAVQARVAWLTNVRLGPEPPRKPRSRGDLPLMWLDGTPIDRFTRDLDPAAYGAFNLVVGDLGTGQWHWLTNQPLPRRDTTRDDAPKPAEPPDPAAPTGLHCEALAPGVYGLSNAALDTPWPKTRQLRAALQTALVAHPIEPEHTLWHALADRRTPPDASLPQTGVPLEWERALSAVWVDHPSGYGTRTSALLSVTASETGTDGVWRWRMQERTWRPEHQQGLRTEAWETSPPGVGVGNQR